MASIVAKLLPPLLSVNGKQTLFGTVQISTFTVPITRQGSLAITAKATSESSESSLSVVKIVKNVNPAMLIALGKGLQIGAWDKPEDRVAVIGLGVAAVVGFWASTNLIAAIDRLPLIPSVFEFVGILFSTWFVYRYLLFKPDREELFQAINKSVSDILGQ